MARINRTEITNLNNEFQRFKTGIMQSRKQDYTYFVTQLSRYEKQYKKLGFSNDYTQKLYAFSQLLRKCRLDDFAGIILSSLIKTPFLKPEVKESYIKQALELYREKGDSIHTLARLIDLKIMYKQTKQNHNYTRVLFEEEQELVQICANFKNAKNSFKSYSRKNSPLIKYEHELAKTRVDLAKMLMKTNPKTAKAILEKAKVTFEKENRQKEVDFVNLMLSELA